MNVLLDTCTFLWMINEEAAISKQAREIYADQENVLYLSIVSLWEIALKVALGKLTFPEPPESYIPRKREHFGIDPLSLDERDVFVLPKLPYLHKDPFDRMLVSQAIARGLTILTPDEKLTRYPVATLW